MGFAVRKCPEDGVVGEPGASVPRPVGEGHNTASDPALNPEGPAVWDLPENTSRV